MTRTKSINSILVATMLIVTFATTSLTMQGFAQLSGNPQPTQGAQPQGSPFASSSQVTQSPGASSFAQQSGVSSILQQQQVQQQQITIPTGDISNQGAIANSQAFQRAAAQDASGSLIALQLQNTNVAIPVAADVDANVCGVSVLAEPAPVTCETTPGQ